MKYSKMIPVKIRYHKTPAGELILGSYEEKLCLCDWHYRKGRETVDARIRNFLSSEYVEESSPVIQEAINQLDEYFKKERKEFDLPLLLCGTDFQQSVWKELMQIPFGKTETYLALAKRMGNEKAIRAIASANGANAISIVVPCHRIIGSDGELVGYAGGLKAKKQLLELESPGVQASLF